jgi:NADH dehydrogenase
VKALVLGATGFVGREVVRQLRVRNDEVIAHIRPGSGQRAQWLERWRALGAAVDESPWDAAALAAALTSYAPDVVFILIGTTVKRAKGDGVEGDIYQRVDYGLTKVACDAIRLSKLSCRIVYLSSVGADAQARSAYLRARGQAEAEIKQAGVPWAIARPAIITGDREDSRPGERAGAIVGDAGLAVVGLLGGKTLAARYRSTTNDVLAAALLRLATVTPADQIFDGAALR